MKVNLSLFAALAIRLLFLVGSIPAVAGDYSFSFTVNDPSGADTFAGTFVTGPSEGNGFYLITSIMNGTDNGQPITLLAPGTLNMNDNWLNPGGQPNGMPPYFTMNGFGVEVTAGPDAGDTYTTYWDGSEYMGVCVEGGQPCGPFNVSNLVVTPEIDPSSAMSALALLSGALVVMRGRRKKVTTIT